MELPRSLDVYRDDNLIIQDYDGIFAVPRPLPPLSTDTLVKCIFDAYRNNIKVRLMALTDITPCLCAVAPIEKIEAGMLAMVVTSEVEYYKLLRSNPEDGQPRSASLSIFSMYKDSFDLIENAGTVILAWRFYGVEDSPFLDRQGKVLPLRANTHPDLSYPSRLSGQPFSTSQADKCDATEIETLRLELDQARAEALNNRILKEYMQAKWLTTIYECEDQVSERRTTELIKRYIATRFEQAQKKQGKPRKIVLLATEKHVDTMAEKMTKDKDEEATRPFTKYDYEVFVRTLFAAVNAIFKDEEKGVKGN
ncbi:uncharacterized protein FFUJ_12880 [Fusarium fujikuroi IMI 58289]|uniref:Uncharacterized protein n=1 Tax=Gibberella fujikuroi (strain CBS 195.34 / IMI 58289 / NRRL A-6831) TaxID=1279085 RepID=S0EGM9_GIBF5|nr:uncharacterized protein FFUJ_12880 [Fusarium fujikuroi IMI 58289]CCT72982.1 uncharacterized protein FFUJ_12880 [Fusarium fujikuroi IMI 58289]SCO24816.1 uncharacterized protein FFM5_13821 [Fusarium fujikuroi]